MEGLEAACHVRERLSPTIFGIGIGTEKEIPGLAADRPLTLPPEPFFLAPRLIHA